MIWKANKGAIAGNFYELGLGTIRQKNKGPLCRKYLKFNCIKTLSFGTHKETHPLYPNVSNQKGIPNHPNFTYENIIADNFNESWCIKI